MGTCSAYCYVTIENKIILNFLDHTCTLIPPNQNFLYFMGAFEKHDKICCCHSLHCGKPRSASVMAAKLLPKECSVMTMINGPCLIIRDGGLPVRSHRTLNYRSYERNMFVTVRNSSCGKVMFTHPLGRHPQADTPPGRHSPPVGRHPPVQRTIRILLECILVYSEWNLFVLRTLCKKL